MFYTKLIINGTEYPIAVNVTGEGAPTASTLGDVGMLYMDTLTKKFYRCIAENTWEPLLLELEEKVETLEAKVNGLLYEDIAIDSFMASINTFTTIEIPSGTKDVVSVRLYAKLNRTPMALTLRNHNGTTETLSNVAETTMTKSVGAPSSPASYTWTLTATGEKDESVSRSASINFYNGVYYGTYPASNTDSNLIRQLTKELRNSHKSSFSVNAIGGQHIYYCVPVRFGTCKFKIGGFEGGFFEPQIISFTNASDYTEDYYVYMSKNSNLGETTVEVIYG